MNRLPAVARNVAVSRLMNPSLTVPSFQQNGVRTYARPATRASPETFTRRLTPMLDRVIVQKAEAVKQTKGGIVIPDKAQGKVLEGTVVAVGPGARNERGENVPMAVSVGDVVILPEYGGTKVEIDDSEVFIYREHDILAKVNE